MPSVCSIGQYQKANFPNTTATSCTGSMMSIALKLSGRKVIVRPLMRLRLNGLVAFSVQHVKLAYALRI